ncbi:MAG: diguanylate cyclase [Anaerolineaceae bacterium]|nr:diguanylate cyclase [Anaerolineaceae bacterium]
MDIAAVLYSLPYWFTGVIAVGIILSLWAYRSRPGAPSFACMALEVALWSGSAAVRLLVTAPTDKVFWTGANTIILSFVPFTMLSFALEYARQKRFPLLVHILLHMEPIGVAGLVWAGASFYNAPVIENGAAMWAAQTLPAFEVHLALLYAAVGIALFILAQVSNRIRKQYRGQVSALLVALYLPWMGYLLDLLGLSPGPAFEWTGLGLLASALLLVLIIIHYRLFAIVPFSKVTIIEGLSDGVIILDLENRILECNPAAQGILPCFDPSVVGQRLVDILSQSDCVDLLSMPSDTEAASREVTINGADDQLRYYDMHVAPFANEADTVAGRLVTLHDITEQKELQAALSDSEEKYRNLVERSNDGVAIVQDDYLRYINPQLAASLGYATQELLNRPFYALIAEEHRPLVADSLRRRRSGEAVPNRYEANLLHRDGQVLPVEINAGLMQYQGQIAVLAFIRDMTEHKQTEAELERSLALLRATIELTVDGILVVLNSGSVALCNQRFAEMWQLPQEWITESEMETRIHMLSQHTLDPQGFIDQTMEIVHQPNLEHFDLIELKDGRALERYSAPFYIAEKIAGRLWNFRDVTIQRGAERDLQSANERLRHSVSELEHHNQEVTLLSEMGNLLHSCKVADEAYHVVANFSAKLFPSQAGALFILNPSRSLAEQVISWGETSVTEPYFPPEACWGFRRGRMHAVEDPLRGLGCQHIHLDEGAQKMPYICVPMMAQGEVIGIFHLRGQPLQMHGAWEQLAETVAEQTAMALANLNLQETLRRQSIRDPLTGLFNRRYMEEFLERELRRASRHKRHVGVLMLDLDHFKVVNDTYGHKAGDEVLKLLGAYMMTNSRGEDVPCRYGGEEFVLILPEISIADLRERASGLREGVKQMRVEYRQQLLDSLTISIGAAIYPDHGPSVESMLLAADSALYQAKKEGRDRVIISGQESFSV